MACQGFQASKLSSAVSGMAVLAGLVGCGSPKPQIPTLAFNPSKSARVAFTMFDKNNDGKLANEELRDAPGIASARKSIDANRDGVIDEAELTRRLQSYLDSRIGIQSLTCVVTVNGRPLENAVVDFEPEQLFDGALSPAQATINREGSGPVMTTSGRLPGISPGIYRVRISKKSGDKETVPTKYNSATTLGFEVAPEAGEAPARFDLGLR